MSELFLSPTCCTTLSCVVPTRPRSLRHAARARGADRPPARCRFYWRPWRLLWKNQQTPVAFDLPATVGLPCPFLHVVDAITGAEPGLIGE